MRPAPTAPAVPVPEEGRCDACGMAGNDPIHDRWHKVLTWNAAIFADAEQARQREFEGRLLVHDQRYGRPGETLEPQGSLALDDVRGQGYRANPV